MTATVTALPARRTSPAAAVVPAPRTAVHHRLTGHQIDLLCRAADLPDWVGYREVANGGPHPVIDGDAPLAALVRYGRHLGTHRCLTLVGLDAVELAQLLAGLATVAPAAYRDVAGLIYATDDAVPVTHLLGIEVVR